MVSLVIITPTIEEFRVISARLANDPRYAGRRIVDGVRTRSLYRIKGQEYAYLGHGLNMDAVTLHHFMRRNVEIKLHAN